MKHPLDKNLNKGSRSNFRPPLGWIAGLHAHLATVLVLAFSAIGCAGELVPETISVGISACHEQALVDYVNAPVDANGNQLDENALQEVLERYTFASGTARRIVEGRPYNDFSEIDAIFGVGRGTIRKLGTLFAGEGLTVCQPGTEYRTIDGVGNNVQFPDRGATGALLLRHAPSAYPVRDGSRLAGAQRQSARAISNQIFAERTSKRNARGASDYLWAWGQFIDHDLDLTEGSGASEHADIPVPVGDPHFDPQQTGTAVIEFERTPRSFDAAGNAQHRNGITAFIDASNIYGSTPARALALRKNDGSGELKLDRGFLPRNDFGACTTDGECAQGTCQPAAAGNGAKVCALDNAGSDRAGADALFLAGDVRANEVVTLTALHTLFVREHNRLVGELRRASPNLDGQTLYQEARRLVAAELQAITFREFLPVMLGANNVSAYSGYDAVVDPSISNVFATAAYRVGHTMLSSDILRLNEDRTEHAAGMLTLRGAFFRPDMLLTTDLGPIFSGIAAQPAREIDAKVVDDVRNMLFGPPGSGGLDLASLNIQRGRDHGLPDYNTVRASFGLPRVARFSEISSDPAVVAALEASYADVDDIDVWVGGLCEDHISGAMVGELFLEIIGDQFDRLRHGDRFWYERDLSPSQIALVESRPLSRIIEDNTQISANALQTNVFEVRQESRIEVGGQVDVELPDQATIEHRIDVPQAMIEPSTGLLSLEIEHSFMTDLTVELRAPNGQTMTVVDNASGSPLSRTISVSRLLDGSNMRGAWTLIIVDNAALDAGTLTRAELELF